MVPSLFALRRSVGARQIAKGSSYPELRGEAIVMFTIEGTKLKNVTRSPSR